MMLSGSSGAALKLSYPKEFNDPYELFLGVGRSEDPGLLAFYSEVVGDLPQVPTTCFSRFPAVIPMWAHYGHGGKGFAVELDYEVLAARYPSSVFGEVDYRDAADPRLNGALKIAYTTTKPRHTYMVRRAVFSAAYFTKASCWSYEQEIRMVVPEKQIRRVKDSKLLVVPRDAVTRLIAGPRSTKKLRTFLHSCARKMRASYVEMRIGHSTPSPHFVGARGQTWVFGIDGFARTLRVCDSCGDPVAPTETLCPVCAVQDADRAEAARRNPYRILENAGMLQGYLRKMNEITERHRKLDEG